MNGISAKFVYLNLKKGFAWQFGPAWPGQRCLAKTRRDTACLKPALKGKTRCQLHGGKATGARTIVRRQRLTDAQARHGKYTETELARAKHRAKIGRRVRGQLKRLAQEIENAGLMPTDD